MQLLKRSRERSLQRLGVFWNQRRSSPDKTFSQPRHVSYVCNFTVFIKRLGSSADTDSDQSAHTESVFFSSTSGSGIATPCTKDSSGVGSVVCASPGAGGLAVFIIGDFREGGACNVAEG